MLELEISMKIQEEEREMKAESQLAVV